MLRRLGIEFDRIQKEIEATVSPMNGPVSIGEIPFTSNAKRVLELAVDEARQMGHNYVGTEHILLGLIHEPVGGVVSASLISVSGSVAAPHPLKVNATAFVILTPQLLYAASQSLL